VAGNPDPIENRLKDISKVGGAGALAIAVLFATGTNAAIQTLVTGLQGGIPDLDVEGAQALVGVFLVTAPLAIAATIVMFGLVRVTFTPENEMIKLIAFVGGAMVVGLVLGSWIYQTLFDTQLVVNLGDHNSTLQRAGGAWQAKVVAAIMWLLIGYYELFGFTYFVAALIAAGVAAYAAHRYLPPGPVATW
jgi:hypothetical protein